MRGVAVGRLADRPQAPFTQVALEAAQHLVGTTGEQLEELAGGCLVAGLAERAAVDDDVGVAADHQRIRGVGRGRLTTCVLQHRVGRVALADLLDLRHHDLEQQPEPLEKLAALWRPRGEDDLQP